MHHRDYNLNTVLSLGPRTARKLQSAQRSAIKLVNKQENKTYKAQLKEVGFGLERRRTEGDLTALTTSRKEVAVMRVSDSFLG